MRRSKITHVCKQWLWLIDYRYGASLAGLTMTAQTSYLGPSQSPRGLTTTPYIQSYSWTQLISSKIQVRKLLKRQGNLKNKLRGCLVFRAGIQVKPKQVTFDVFLLPCEWQERHWTIYYTIGLPPHPLLFLSGFCLLDSFDFIFQSPLPASSAVCHEPVNQTFIELW